MLIYNGKNASVHGTPEIGAGAYSDGQALFSADDPRKLLARGDKAVLQTRETVGTKAGNMLQGQRSRKG